MNNAVFDIIVKNRFTGKVYETHNNVSINVVYQVQDHYMFRPWAKVKVGSVEE